MNDYCADSTRVVHPLFQGEGGGSSPTSALHARDLMFSECPKPHAVKLVKAWHSRLPNCPRGPWTQAFHAQANGITYAVALWNNPSTRCLPSHYRELRRMACAPDAPRNTASRFLAWMVRWFDINRPECEKLISYQDTAVHTGTIYRAAGWVAEWTSTPRDRDRTVMRSDAPRQYRTASNGKDVDLSAKVRWSKMLTERTLPPARKAGDDDGAR